MRCVLVVVQYVAKLHKEKLIKAVQGIEALRGLAVLGKKQYNMRLLEGSACRELTGCGHNAVTPLGQHAMPIVLSDQVARLQRCWLGGGHRDLKLQLDLQEALRLLNWTVADVTA